MQEAVRKVRKRHLSSSRMVDHAPVKLTVAIVSNDAYIIAKLKRKLQKKIATERMSPTTV